MVKIYVEGGGYHNPSLAQDCRKGFKQFFNNAGFEKRPSVVACGSRRMAYEDYCVAVKNGQPAMLLVDSEAPIQEQFEQGDLYNWKPWEQLNSRTDQAGNKCDPWDKMGNDTDCHLMVQMMESWFLADVDTVKSYFKAGFKDLKFPNKDENIEDISKDRIEDILASSTKNTSKTEYKKGRDSFTLLGKIDPAKVGARSKWSKRFLSLLKERMDSV